MQATNRYVSAVLGVIGVMTLIAGVWAYSSPSGFAEFVRFPSHEHFLHDVGAFQVGLGLMLLFALIWADAVALVLTAFLAANTLHAVAHFADLDLGGTLWSAVVLAAASVLIALALWLRLRAVGYVVGRVQRASDARLAPFVHQKTVSLTTYRKNGQPGQTPVSIAVDGDRAYVRSFEKSLKTRRLSRDPRVEVAASTGFGTVTGAPVAARMRRLDGDENRHAARMLRRKHPMLHGVLVPFTHRVGRRKTGRTVHFELLPVVGQDGQGERPGRPADDAARAGAAGRG